MLATSILNLGIWGQAASPLPLCLIFSPTVYSQCTHYSWVGWECRLSRNVEQNFCPGRDSNLKLLNDSLACIPLHHQTPLVMNPIYIYEVLSNTQHVFPIIMLFNSTSNLSNWLWWSQEQKFLGLILRSLWRIPDSSISTIHNEALQHAHIHQWSWCSSY